MHYSGKFEEKYCKFIDKDVVLFDVVKTLCCN